MAKITNIATKKENNLLVTPRELLYIALEELDKNPNIKSAFVILVEPTGEDTCRYDTFRANLKWEREVCLLDWAHYKCLTRADE